VTLPTVTAEMSVDTMSIQQYLAHWQGKIAVAAADGGLDTFRAALVEIEQQVSPDRGLLEHAKSEIWDAAFRHLNSVVGRDALAAIYASVFAEVPPDTEGEIDAATAEGDARSEEAAEIGRLSKLDPLEYARQRRSSADKLGIGVGMLDAVVKTARAAGNTTAGQGRPLDLPETEPWPEPVEGAGLLDAIAAKIDRHVVLSDAASVATALWCVATHTFDSFNIFARLTLRSPTPQCGKTTLRDVVAGLVSKPLPTDNILAAALFRTIEMARPTLLLDEADTYLNRNEDLRNVIDSGHSREGRAIRCVGDNYEPRQFSTWSPLLLAMIGSPPPTIYDRSIIINLRRKKPGEEIERLRGHARKELHVLARKAARWTRDNATRLAHADPGMLDYLSDRANDNWHSLLAVADIAGGQWPQRARLAARQLTETTGHDASSTGEMLIADVRWIFEGRPEQRGEVTTCAVDKISSADLADQLADIEGRPWAEWKGKRISQNGLARLLRPFGIVPGTIRLENGQTPKGYKREDFREAFAQYGELQTATPPQSSQGRLIPATETATIIEHVAVPKSQESNIERHCGAVAVSDASMEDAEIPAAEEAIL